jgi:hypothetical protein
VVSFSKYRQCIITAPVVPTACLRVRYAEYAFTRSVHQPPAYASGAPLKHWLIRGEVRQYIDHVVYLNRIDSHHHPKEHTILYVFRAPGYDLLVLLSWYKHWSVSAHRLAITRHLPPNDIYDSDYPFRLLVRPAGRSEVGDYGPITNSVYLFKS